MRGDVNGDGIADLLIGAYVGGQSNAGRSYVVLGGPGSRQSRLVDTVTALNGVNGFKLEGAKRRMTSVVVGLVQAGDINQDGYDDLVIGAPHGGFRTPLLAGIANWAQLCRLW